MVPDLLHAVYGRPGSDGRIAGVAGDSYILLVEWDGQGRVSSRSIQPYGSATLDRRSPHYADQAPLFAAGRLKPVWMDESEIRAHLEREYRPGDSPARRQRDETIRISAISLVRFSQRRGARAGRVTASPAFSVFSSSARVSVTCPRMTNANSSRAWS